MDKHIPTNNRITGYKPSQQLFPKQAATRHLYWTKQIGHTEVLKLKHLKIEQHHM